MRRIKNAKTKKGLSLLICVVMILTILSVSYTYAETENISANPPKGKIVRVGTFTSFNEEADLEQQPYAQYTKAFLDKIALYTGWQLEYVQIDVENERVEDLLLEGKIDLGTLSVKTDANKEKIGFSNLKYGTLQSNLIALTENKNIFSSDYSTFEGMRVAVVEGDVYHVRALDEFCDINDISYTKVLVPSYEAALAAMQKGEADTAVAVNVISIEDTKTVATIGEAPFFFSFARGRTDIARGVNQSLENIFEVDEDFQKTLEKQYFEEEEYEIKLTKAEQEYIEKNKEVKLVVAAEAIPLQYFDPMGELQGISAIFLDEISELTGLDFTVIRMGKETRDIKKFAEDSDAKLILGPTSQQFEHSEGLFDYTTTLLQAELVLCSNRGVSPKELGGKVFAAVRDGEQMEFELDIPRNEIKYYENYEKVFEAINDGRADYTYCNQLVATYYLLQSGYDNIISVPLNKDILSYKFALVNDDEMLQSILNKAIGSLSESTRQEIVLNGMKQNVESYDFNPLLDKYGAEIFFVLAVIACAIAALIGAKVRDTRELLIERMKVIKHNELTDELIYEYDVKKDTFKASESVFEKFGMACEVPNYTEYIKNNIGQTAFKRFLQDYREKLMCEEGEIGIVSLETVDGKVEYYKVINAIVRNRKGNTALVLGKLVSYNVAAEKTNILITDYSKKEDIKREFIYDRR